MHLVGLCNISWKQVQLLRPSSIWEVTQHILVVLPTFRDNLSVSSSRIKQSKKNAGQQVAGILLALLNPERLSRNFGKNYQHRLRNFPEERLGSLQSREFSWSLLWKASYWGHFVTRSQLETWLCKLTWRTCECLLLCLWCYGHTAALKAYCTTLWWRWAFFSFSILMEHRWN